MAADTRQFADHFELDGSNVYVEDKKLGELKDKTAVTTIDATNQFIPLQDVDGNIQKISKSSFTDAVRNVLGDLLINNDKGVSISGIPALSGSGSSLDFGSVSPANLASVLGGISNRGVNIDADTIINTGSYQYDSASVENHHVPSPGWGTLICFGGNFTIQIICIGTMTNSAAYIRFQRNPPFIQVITMYCDIGNNS